MGSSASSFEAPAEMRRLVLTEPCDVGEDGLPDYKSCRLAVETVPTPVPRSGQVLVKMAAAPLNPSDYGAWKKSGEGPAGNAAKDGGPRPIGLEGSGVVVASGGGMMASRLVGKNVGVMVKGGSGQGSFSEYVCVSATGQAFALGESVPVEDGCSFLVNPWTVVGLVETALSLGSSSAFINTAAASQVRHPLFQLSGQLLCCTCASPSRMSSSLTSFSLTPFSLTSTSHLSAPPHTSSASHPTAPPPTSFTHLHKPPHTSALPPPFPAGPHDGPHERPKDGEGIHGSQRRPPGRAARGPRSPRRAP